MTTKTAAEIASENLYQKFPSPTSSIDTSYNMYAAKGDGTEGRFAITTLLNFFNQTPYTKVTTAAELVSALTLGGYIYVPVSITMTANLQLSADTTILFATGAQLIAGAFRIEYNEKSLTLISSNDQEVVVTYIPTVDGNSFLYNAGGDSFSSILNLANCRIKNLGEVANTPVSLNAAQVFHNASVVAGDADNAGVYITRPNSSVNGLTVLTSNSPASTNIFKTEDGTCVIDDLTLANVGGVSGTLATFGAFNKMSKINPFGDSASNIIMEGSCEQLISKNDADVNLTLNGSQSRLINFKVNNIDTSGSDSAALVGGYVAGTSTLAANTIVAGCNGNIINTGNQYVVDVVAVDTAPTTSPGHIYIMTADASDLVVNLPSPAALRGRTVAFKRMDATAREIEIDSPSGTINGAGGFIMLTGAGTYLEFVSDGTNFWTT